MPENPQVAANRPVLALGLLAAFAVLAVLTVLSITVGSVSVPGRAVYDALFHFDPADNEHLIVRDMRLPRTVIGLLAGAALGLSGAVMQGLARNPLADPGILGVNAGAALFVVCGISIFGVVSVTGYVWFGFAGAAAAAILVYRIGAMGRDGVTPVKLALSGAATSAALASLTTAILLTDTEAFDRFRFWQVGSLAGRDLDIAWQALPFLTFGALLALICGRLLNALSLGDDVAQSLGVNVKAGQAFAALAVVVLCGTATAMAGPIAFVGLAVPHAARMITGPDHRWILPFSAVLAPSLLLGSDIIGRIITSPGEVQVGVVTAVIGAPIFIALVRRRKLAEL
ncbi:FecCD family ABC transporter permease [Kibdelosporangium phytohabitans]|uniref:Iron ABC transporter permease n=1 Tax=Kibdelosporangium phytohabitans TaxID=860235 RepID=A0A0N9HNP0_9PSEU|nr:iron chelate uptake ABC transporter family permease subunit [Kibdelosporangium phytohabitans]ALG08600.1 iron ABC transporter permease [Kibdelosporangium phytohabitans]MBE1470318.1 iron complex transport system permease protein [Kibdelosporangium phytohabitans]